MLSRVDGEGTAARSSRRGTRVVPESAGIRRHVVADAAADLGRDRLERRRGRARLHRSHEGSSIAEECQSYHELHCYCYFLLALDCCCFRIAITAPRVPFRNRTTRRVVTEDATTAAIWIRCESMNRRRGMQRRSLGLGRTKETARLEPDSSCETLAKQSKQAAAALTLGVVVAVASEPSSSSTDHTAQPARVKTAAATVY